MARASQVAQWRRILLPRQERQETQVRFLGQEDPLEKMAPRSTILAWKIPWTEEPGGLQSMRSQRVVHNWVCMHAHTCVRTHTQLHSGKLSTPWDLCVFFLLYWLIHSLKNKQWLIHNGQNICVGDKPAVPMKSTFHSAVCCFYIKLSSFKKEEWRGFPGGPLVRNLPANAGDTGLVPGQGTEIAHVMGQLSPCITTHESQRKILHAATKPRCN